VLHVAAEFVQGAACNHGARVLHRDYETRSQATLKKVGTSRYATNSSTTILCCAYAVDDGPAQLWIPGDPVPAEFVQAATNPNWMVCAHGAHFEDAIERHVLHPRFDWPAFPIEKQRCTQQCVSHSDCQHGSVLPPMHLSLAIGRMLPVKG
jgi:hypothetical protein